MNAKPELVRGERLEPERLEHARRTRVPRVGNDERLPLVQGAERLSLLLLPRHVSSLSTIGYGRVVISDVHPNAGTETAGEPPAPGMHWIPGATFAMGSEDFYPEERPVHGVRVDGFWMDEHPVTVGRVPALRARRPAMSRSPSGHSTLPTIPDADPDLLVPGSLVFRKTARPRRPRRLPQLVGVRAGRQLEAPRRAGQDHRRARPTSGHACRLRGRRSVRRVGRQGAADRGGVGVCSPWRPRGRGIRVG